MNSIGDGFDVMIGKHVAGDFAMAHRHAVDISRKTQRQLCHVKRAVQHLKVSERSRAAVAQHLADQVGWETIMASRNRSMRRKNTLTTYRLDFAVRIPPFTPRAGLFF